VSKYRVCVADDDPEVADILCEGLRLNDYDAVVARNGQEALDVCAKGDIDLILLDVLMPDIDGYEVCRRLKSSIATQDILVIFVTVKGSLKDVSLGRRLGAVDYITKPYNLPMVMLRVDSALRNKNVEDSRIDAEEAFAEIIDTDHLTGLRSRHFLMERLQEEVEKAHRYSFPVSCCVFDIDEVRALDEDLGTVSLDDLLAELALILRNQARSCDVVARCDFSEFAVVLPHATIDDAVNFANRIIKEVSETTFSHPTFPTQTSLCAGIVTYQDDVGRSAEYVFREAMCRLLEAKSVANGRVVARILAA